MKITQIISDCLLNHSVYILIHKKRKEEKEGLLSIFRRNF